MDHLDALAQLARQARQNAAVPRELRPSDVPPEVVRAAEALGAPVRLAILRALADDGPLHQQALGDSLGLSRTTVQKNITALVDAGAVIRTTAGDNPRGRPVTYTLDVDEIERLGAALVRWAIGRHSTRQTGSSGS